MTRIVSNWLHRLADWLSEPSPDLRHHPVVGRESTDIRCLEQQVSQIGAESQNREGRLEGPLPGGWGGPYV